MDGPRRFQNRRSESDDLVAALKEKAPAGFGAAGGLVLCFRGLLYRRCAAKERDRTARATSKTYLVCREQSIVRGDGAGCPVARYIALVGLRLRHGVSSPLFIAYHRLLREYHHAARRPFREQLNGTAQRAS
jgi:hypothetical protein